MITRRDAARLAAVTATTMLAGGRLADAQGSAKLIKIGIDLSLTGADAESAQRILHGAQMAFDDANAKHEIPGYQLQVITYDDGTATAGQDDPHRPRRTRVKWSATGSLLRSAR